jgi:hypothetical protein
MNRHSTLTGVALVASSLMLASAAAAQGAAPAAPGAPSPAAGVAAPSSATAGASSEQADTGATATPKSSAPPKKLKWRGTTLEWDNDASAATVGLGQSYQSRDPYYDMEFTLRPRYYIYDDSASDVATLGTAVAATRATRTSISLQGVFGGLREFTNSDTTTEQGEWTLTDWQVYAALSHQLFKSGDFVTNLTVDLPELTFPTSKFSMDSGMILGLGALAGITQQLPILGSKSAVFQALSLEVAAGYNHTFTEATTGTNSSLSYVRMDPDGVALPSDQLNGAALAEHEAKFTVLADIQITDRIDWGNEWSWRPVWKYTFGQTQVCNVVSTSCATPTQIANPSNFDVVTLFDSEVDVRILDQLGIGIGYENLTAQRAPDSSRRGIFYSPDSRVYLSVVGYLDEIYKAATAPGKGAEQSAGLKRVPHAE